MSDARKRLEPCCTQCINYDDDACDCAHQWDEENCKDFKPYPTMKPCPACGETKQDMTKPYDLDCWNLRCYRTGCGWLVVGDTPAECIERWNKRTILDATAAPLEAEVEEAVDVVREALAVGWPDEEDRAAFDTILAALRTSQAECERWGRENDTLSHQRDQAHGNQEAAEQRAEKAEAERDGAQEELIPLRKVTREFQRWFAKESGSLILHPLGALPAVRRWLTQLLEAKDIQETDGWRWWRGYAKEQAEALRKLRERVEAWIEETPTIMGNGWAGLKDELRAILRGEGE